MTKSERIILHAGLPKTGTTYLQQGFVANRGWLAGRSICYPEVGQEHGAGHHNLALRLRGLPALDVDDPATPADELLRRAVDSTYPTLLLSSEGFSALDNDAAETLLDVLAGRELRVVLFLRRRSRLCVSAWQEHVKLGSPSGFLEFLAQELLGSSFRVLRPEHTLRRAHDLCGESALRVVVYDHLVEDGIDLLDFFVGSILGHPVDDAFVRPEHTSNPSLPPPILEVLRAANQARAGRGEPADIVANLRLLRWLAEATEGHDLVRRVAAVLDRRGEDLDLRALDGEWQDRDRHVRRALGDSFLNAADSESIFRETEPVPHRILRPAQLYDEIPPSVFSELLTRIPRAEP